MFEGAEVSLFQVAEVPTNRYDYMLPNKITVCNFFESCNRLLIKYISNKMDCYSRIYHIYLVEHISLSSFDKTVHKTAEKSALAEKNVQLHVQFTVHIYGCVYLASTLEISKAERL